MGQLPFTMGGFYSSLAYVIFIRLQYFWGQFWLQIVGTFQAETDEEIAYGLVHPLASWDPIWTQVRTFTGTKHKSNKLHMVWFVEPCTSARFPIWKAMKWWCVLPPRLHLDAKFLSPIDLVIEDSLVIWDTVLFWSLWVIPIFPLSQLVRLKLHLLSASFAVLSWQFAVDLPPKFTSSHWLRIGHDHHFI